MEWQLPLNISKRKILHLGHSNPMFSYTTHMDGNLLEKVSEERILGVIIDKELKFHSHTALVVNKANRMLGLIRHCFVNLSFTTLTNLYKALILEYSNTIWVPFILQTLLREYSKKGYQTNSYYSTFNPLATNATIVALVLKTNNIIITGLRILDTRNSSLCNSVTEPTIVF